LKAQASALKRIIQPYLFISVAGILAFAPVSFMLRALKNDIVALEYPINYFISQCIRNGEVPYWFNTWGMGFPLQSNLTWGIYSTPQVLFGAAFNYNIYTLHLELLFFILLSGWGMFHLLHRYFLKDQKIAQLLAVCYMLSGFMVGSTQWLLYITAAAFVPLVVSALLALLWFPSWKNAFQFAVVYTMMFTSVYAAFNIITTYALVAFVIIYFIRKKQKGDMVTSLKYVAIAGAFTAILCFPCLYYMLELLQYIDRGNGIDTGSAFFNSNYLHPGGLMSVLLPFSSVRMNFEGTEGTMLNTYLGLFTVLLLPLAIKKMIGEKNKLAWALLIASILFLTASFGYLTPLRNALNVLPGFSYFRNPAIFRFYFITTIIIYLAVLFRHNSFEEVFHRRSNYYLRNVRYTIYALIGVYFILAVTHISKSSGLISPDITGLLKNISLPQAILVSSILQLAILLALLISVNTNKLRLARWLFALDLIVNTVICTPFFSVSSYPVSRVNDMLHSIPGFPVQQSKVNSATAMYVDQKMNTWHNRNVFTKEVSSRYSYRTALNLKHFSRFVEDSIIAYSLFDHPLVYAHTDTTNLHVTILIQKPTHVQASVQLGAADTITLFQNYYPGWKAFYNGKEVELLKIDNPGISILAAAGPGIIDFRYERRTAWISALLLHVIVILFVLWKIYDSIKRRRIR
jgi:hypothetical protein